MIAVKQTVVDAMGQRVEISRQGIQLSRTSFTGLSPAQWRKLLTHAWRIGGQYWHQAMLPKHFTHAGATEYGYQGRHPTYLQRKRRKWGHTYPLVWSGETKLRTMRIQDVRADDKGARVILHAPKHLYQYRKDLRQPDKARELTAVSETDAKAVARVMDRWIAKELKRTGGAAGGGHRGEGPSIYGSHSAAASVVAQTG